MSVNDRNGYQMDNPLLRFMILKDNKLLFKELEGDTIHELWPKFKALLQQYQLIEFNITCHWNASTQDLVPKM